MQAPSETAPLPAATGSDPVGFGKHAELSYDEVWSKEPGYCMWTMKKFRELVEEELERDTPFAEGDSMMKRLALWIIEKEKVCEANGPAFEYDANMELVEVPGTRSLKERVAAALADKPAKYYGIAFPEKRVCTNWEECKPLVHGVKGVVYRSFATREEAEDFVENPPQRPQKKQKQKPTKSADDHAQPADAPTKKPKAAPKKKKATTPTEDARRDDSPGAVDGSAEGDAESDGKRIQAEQAETTGDAKKRRSAPRAKSAAKKQKTEAVASSGSQVADDAAPDAEGDSETKVQAKKEATGSAKSKAKSKAKAKAKVKAKDKSTAKAKAKAQAKEKEAKGKAKAKAASKEKEASDSTSKPAAPKGGATAKTPVQRAAPKAKKSAEPTKPDTAPLSEDLLQQAEALGMAAELRILANRPEIVSLKFPGNRILGALKEAEGLVNKAKSMLLGTGPTTPERSPMPEKSASDRVTPAKTEQADQHHMQHMNELRALLGEGSLPVSQDLGEQATQKSNVSAAAPEERQQTPGLTEEQLARIKENREKAAAKKRLLEAGA
eukprot:TRINITY_DN58179_c0_g1_i1.p1 TRINITY_DN58179_c0_g1~~TRINITY_DN58179_c0_g1_i1.p1  ORF type:complete len:553 (-),score=161.51 TRINITY_DN58179_c0_g1_i1:117-1775(-)